jgi:1,4-dihydroxy-2-naphthoate octaprenyltransferase
MTERSMTSRTRWALRWRDAKNRRTTAQLARISSPAAALQAILVGGAAAMLKQESIDGTAALARRVVSLLVMTR